MAKKKNYKKILKILFLMGEGGHTLSMGGPILGQMLSMFRPILEKVRYGRPNFDTKIGQIKHVNPLGTELLSPLRVLRGGGPPRPRSRYPP